MGFIESAKAFAFRTADVINKWNDPFPPFDRVAIPKENKKLFALEKEFYDDLVNHFWGCGGQVLLHRIPLPTGSPLDTGDQAIWHGVYTAVLAMRYHGTSDEAARAELYGHLVDATKGLRLHQTIHGETQARLIRGVSDDRKTWQDDASNDSATGHLFGIYATWKWGPESLQPLSVELAAALGSELLNHDHCLVGADGKPTTYGALVQGWKTDPLRLTLALAIYKVAATLTKEKAFSDAYEDLSQKYKALIPYPKVKLWWAENQNDTHRAAIHLAILADLTQGDQCAMYCRGLRRIRGMVSKLGNVWVNALCSWGTQMIAPDDRDHALKVLSEFTLKDKQFNMGRDNYKELQRASATGWSWYKPVLWNGIYMASQPLPRWAARAQDFFWQRNLRSLDIGTGWEEANSRLNGGDYLAAYWLSRLSGTLSVDD